MTEASQTPVIEIANLAVHYGQNHAIEDVSLSVPEGSVFALLGRNGAGKSSLIRCLLGHQRPTSGRLTVMGYSPWNHRRSLMARVGCVAETPDLPPGLSTRRLGNLCAGLQPGWNRERFDHDIEHYEIDSRTPFENLSRGQKALVAIALALAGEPDILVLDDPTLGLDAIARMAILDGLIADLAERSTTVFLATHDLLGVERIADHVGILHHGRLLVAEPLETLKGRFRKLNLGAFPNQIPFRIHSHRDTGLGVELVVDDFDAKLDNSATDERVLCAPMSLEEIFVAIAAHDTTEEPTR